MPLARACQSAGIAVLIFDHSSFGESDGDPRCCVDWWGQLNGYWSALNFLESRGSVDGGRLAVWGFSFTSAIALVLGALDERVRAVVARKAAARERS